VLSPEAAIAWPSLMYMRPAIRGWSRSGEPRVDISLRSSTKSVTVGEMKQHEADTSLSRSVLTLTGLDALVILRLQQGTDKITSKIAAGLTELEEY
jgi:hypothetical protein